jgi:hypothetical protein
MTRVCTVTAMTRVCTVIDVRGLQVAYALIMPNSCMSLWLFEILDLPRRWCISFERPSMPLVMMLTWRFLGIHEERRGVGREVRVSVASKRIHILLRHIDEISTSLTSIFISNIWK